MASTALVFMMVPGIALFYSGLRSQTTALSLIWLSMMAVSVVSIQVSTYLGRKDLDAGGTNTAIVVSFWVFISLFPDIIERLYRRLQLCAVPGD